MENLAYVYLADAYEAPAESYLVNPWSAQWFQGLNWRRLSSASYIRFVSFGVMLSVLSLTSNAWGLSRGDRGIQVRDLQKRLIVAGYSNVEIDAIYSSETEAAVKQFQIGYGFVPDGIADANTQKILNQKLYVVVVPVRNNTTLTRVQQIFPTAFKAPSASSRLGDYVHAGSSPNYDLAKTRVKSLQQSGIIDARVAYF